MIHIRVTINSWQFGLRYFNMISRLLIVALFIQSMEITSNVVTAFASKTGTIISLANTIKRPIPNDIWINSKHYQSLMTSQRIIRTQSMSGSTTSINMLRGGAGVVTSSATLSGNALSNIQRYFGLSVQNPQHLFNLIFGSIILFVLCSKIMLRVVNNNNNDPNNSNQIQTKPAHVKSLQYRFLAVFWLLRASDWLQGPYFYEVYASKLINGIVPVSMAMVSRLFLTGFASTALFGPLVGKAADQYGRKKATIAFCAIYALGALSTKSNFLMLLFAGRILSGIGTSLLFSAPESWLIGESQKKIQVIKDGGDGNITNESTDSTSYLGETFSLAYSGDSLVAITAGQMAGMAASKRGPTGPFELSTIFLGLGGLLAAWLWKENKAERRQPESNTNAKPPKTSTREAIDICLNDPKIMLVGAVQSLFEAAMYIFVLQWPPAMSRAIQSVYPTGKTPYGTIFSCFMACCLIGSTIFGQLSKMEVPTEKFTSSFLAVATLAMATSTWTILQPSLSMSLPLLTISFFAFEMAVGMYFPSIGTLRSRFVPDSHRTLIMNLAAIPLNVLVVSVFLSINKLGVAGALGISSAALALATLCMIQLRRIVSKEDSKNGKKI